MLILDNGQGRIKGGWINMSGTNIKEIQESFTIQAGNFNDASMNFSKEEYLAYTVSEAVI